MRRGGRAEGDEAARRHHGAWGRVEVHSAQAAKSLVLRPVSSTELVPARQPLLTPLGYVVLSVSPTSPTSTFHTGVRKDTVNLFSLSTPLSMEPSILGTGSQIPETPGTAAFPIAATSAPSATSNVPPSRPLAVMLGGTAATFPERPP